MNGFIKRIGKRLFKCEQCEKTTRTDQFSCQNPQFIKDYIPKVWKEICKACLIREVGKKRYNNFIMGE